MVTLTISLQHYTGCSPRSHHNTKNCFVVKKTAVDKHLIEIVEKNIFKKTSVNANISIELNTELNIAGQSNSDPHTLHLLRQVHTDNMYYNWFLLRHGIK